MKHTKILAALAVAFSFLCTPAYAQNPAKPSGSKAPGISPFPMLLISSGPAIWTG